MKNCKHGIDPATCNFCKIERERRGEKHPQIVIRQSPSQKPLQKPGICKNKNPKPLTEARPLAKARHLRKQGKKPGKKPPGVEPLRWHDFARGGWVKPQLSKRR